MIGMFLSATVEEEVNVWMKRITTYRDILKAHSLNFNITKLASIRMDLLLQRESTDGVADGVGLPEKRLPEEIQEPDEQNAVAQAPLESDVTAPDTPELAIEEFPVDPTLAFGNMYGLEWDADLDQLLSSIDYAFDK